MSLLEGDLQDIFGAVFGSVYSDGTLNKVTRADNGKGGGAVSAVPIAIKGQIDAVTEAMRQAPGYTADDVRLIVLQDGVDESPTSDDTINLGGTKWSISNVVSDAAQTHWVMRGTVKN